MDAFSDARRCTAAFKARQDWPPPFVDGYGTVSGEPFLSNCLFEGSRRRQQAFCPALGPEQENRMMLPAYPQAG